MLPGVDQDALKAYGSSLEEGRADLFALYYLADPKLVELGIFPNMDTYKAEYYKYIMNGLMTQLTRIVPGKDIEEAHMRNRKFISEWCYQHGKKDNARSCVACSPSCWPRYSASRARVTMRPAASWWRPTA